LCLRLELADYERHTSCVKFRLPLNKQFGETGAFLAQSETVDGSLKLMDLILSEFPPIKRGKIGSDIRCNLLEGRAASQVLALASGTSPAHHRSPGPIFALSVFCFKSSFACANRISRFVLDNRSEHSWTGASVLSGGRSTTLAHVRWRSSQRLSVVVLHQPASSTARQDQCPYT